MNVRLGNLWKCPGFQVESYWDNLRRVKTVTVIRGGFNDEKRASFHEHAIGLRGDSVRIDKGPNVPMGVGGSRVQLDVRPRIGELFELIHAIAVKKECTIRDQL